MKLLLFITALSMIVCLIKYYQNNKVGVLKCGLNGQSMSSVNLSRSKWYWK